MNKTLVIYNSKTGFTQRYAQWLSEALDCECVKLSAAKNCDFSRYETIIFGGWVCAGSVSKLKWFRSRLPEWAGKKLAVFCVGGVPNDQPEAAENLDKMLTAEEKKSVALFYCQGGMNYEKMSAPAKLMMKMFAAAVNAKADKSEADAGMAKMISTSYDISDRKFIEPIVAWAKA